MMYTDHTYPHLLFILVLSVLIFPLQANSNSPVLIIGAGVAGAKLAHDLFQQNIPFLILEATDRIGGRLRTQQLPFNGPFVEIGANWIQGFRPDDSFSDFVKNQLNFSGLATDFDDVYFVRNGVLVPDQDANPVWDRVEQALEKLYDYARLERNPMQKKRDDMSLQSALLLLAGWEADSPIEKEAMRYEIDFEYAIPPSEVSVYSLSPFLDPKGPESVDFFVRDPRGIKFLVEKTLSMAGVADVTTSSENLWLNAPVRKVVYNDTLASVVLRDGTIVKGSAVVSTVSLGVLQESLFKPEELSRLIFEPTFPFRKRKAISKFQIADFMKIYVRFKTDVFKKNDPLFLVPLQCKEAWFQSILNMNKEGYFPGLNVVLITAVDAFSRTLSCLEGFDRDRQILAKVLAYVSLSVGRTVGVEEVHSILVPNLRQDEFFKGSYTYRPPTATEEDLEALNEPLGSIFFAGEAHAMNNLHGYIQGAWYSAQHTASNVVSFLKAKNDLVGVTSGLHHDDSLVQNILSR